MATPPDASDVLPALIENTDATIGGLYNLRSSLHHSAAKCDELLSLQTQTATVARSADRRTGSAPGSRPSALACILALAIVAVPTTAGTQPQRTAQPTEVRMNSGSRFETLMAMGLAAAAHGDQAGSYANYSAANGIAANPGEHCQAVLGMATAEINIKNDKKAVFLCNVAIGYDKKNATAHIQKGIALRRMGDQLGAQKEFIVAGTLGDPRAARLAALEAK